jgi:hypothetical protein
MRFTTTATRWHLDTWTTSEYCQRGKGSGEDHQEQGLNTESGQKEDSKTLHLTGSFAQGRFFLEEGRK